MVKATAAAAAAVKMAEGAELEEVARFTAQAVKFAGGSMAHAAAGAAAAASSPSSTPPTAVTRTSLLLYCSFYCLNLWCVCNGMRC